MSTTTRCRVSKAARLAAGLVLAAAGVFAVVPAAWAGGPAASSSGAAAGSAAAVASSASTHPAPGVGAASAGQGEPRGATAGMQVIEVSPSQRMPLYATVDADGSVSVSHAPSGALSPTSGD